MVQDGFSNRIDWLTPIAAMIVWSAHFALVWLASIALPGDPAARWIALALTIVAAGALAWLWRRAGRPSIFTVPGLGLAIASAGVAYDTLPAVLA